MQHPSALLWSDRAQDKEWLDLLWEVGRSVTIQVRLCPSETDWALARNHASECLKSIKDAALSATFIDFARIVRQLNIQQVSDGTHHKLRFNNAPYNASMHRAAMGILSLINDGPEFEASMSKLELAYGRDLLSNAYSKLNRLQQISKGVATAAQATPNGSAQNSGKVAGWLVGMVHLALRLGLTNPSKATEVWLLGDRKHGTHGYWQACIVALEVGWTEHVNLMENAAFRGKFRGQTSDNMDKWKSRGGKSQRNRRSQKKEDAGAQKGRKAAKYYVFPMACGSGGSKGRLANPGCGLPSFLMLSTSKIEEASQSRFVFDVVYFENWGSLEELFRF